MQTIRILNDETRFYIVIENPTAEDKKAAMDFVSKQMGAAVAEEKPEGVLPTKVEPYKLPPKMEDELSQECIQSITSPEVFVDRYLKYGTLSKSDKDAFMEQGRNFMSDRLNKTRRSDIGQVKKFLMDFEPIFKNTITHVLKINGYKTLKAFLNTESDANIQAVYDKCKKGIRETLNIN